MSGKASASNHPGFSVSGALSHVYIQYPPIRCTLSGTRSFLYDDGNKLLLGMTSDQVFSWKTAPYKPHVAPSSDPLCEGPVLSIRYSLDLKLLAVQLSNYEVQIWNKQTGDTISQKCRSESESILGFIWIDCPTCDIVFVKTSLDFYSYTPELKSLHLVETKKLDVGWYIYTHESRMLLLASGMQCKSFTGYQLSSAGVIRLPRFEMTMAKSEANNKPILAAEDVHIITVYGRIYCLQFDRVAMLLHSYRFYRDAVIQQAISAGSSDTPSVLEFLQRRKLEANKAKHLCLEIALILILERRSLPVVVRAIDVLITTYSQAIKTSSYQKRTNTEEASPSGMSNLNSSNTVVGKFSRVDASGIKQDSVLGVENESSNRSTLTASVSDGSVSFETKKMISHNLDSSSSKNEGEYMVPEASGAQVDASVVQSQILEPGSKALNANASEQLGSQVSSAAISAADLDSLCLWPLRERLQEMHLTWFPSLLSSFTGIFF